MRSGRTRTQNVDDLEARDAQNVREQRPVAAPPDRLRTHDGRAEPAREVDELHQTLGEGFGEQVVGVSAEPRVAPGGIGRIGLGAPATAQLREPDVRQAAALERGGQRLRPELGLAPGPRVPPHVGQRLDLVFGEQVEELRGTPGGMPDGPDARMPHGVRTRSRSPLR